MQPETFPFVRKVFVATVIPLAAVLIVLLISRVISILLVFFIGVLFALGLRAGGELIVRITRLPYTLALLVFLLFIIGVTAVFAWFAVPQIADQMGQLSERLPQSVQRIEETLRSVPWLNSVLQQVPQTVQSLLQGENALLSQLRTIFSITAGTLAGAAIVFVVGIYLATHPSLYTETFVQLFPVTRRERMLEIFARLAHVLRMWLIGRAIGMAFVGVLTAIGLLILGVPLPLALGFIAALLDFIPNIGPIIAAAPAILIALTESMQTAVYVIIVYIIVQELESYLIVPMIEQKVVSLAPAYNVIVQIVFAIVFGFLGLLLATPLMVTVMVLIQEMYIKDVLEAAAKAERRM